MRDLFVWALKLSAWLTPLYLAYYGYGVGESAAPGSGLGVVGAMVGLFVGALGWLFYMGLADLAETTWSNQSALANITDRLEKIAKTAGNEEAEEAAQLAALVSKVTEVKSSLDDLHEGLGDVMEETLARIAGIKAAVTTPAPETRSLAPSSVVAPSMDLSQIPSSENR